MSEFRRLAAGRSLMVLSVVFSLLAPAATRAQEPAVPRLQDTADLSEIPARWAPLMQEFRVPGMAVAVVKDGRLHAVGTFGHRDAAQSSPVTPDTRFYVASITKTYVAFLVCMLAVDGKLSLDDPVNEHLPRFELADAEATESITIRDLLSHRAGLESMTIETLEAYTGEITEDRFYRWLERVRPDPEITYSNLHYTLLGRIVGAVTGKPWRDALQERVITPAGMSRTSGSAQRLYSDEDHADPLVHDDGWKLAALVKTDATMHAAGGLGTTALDAARWLELNLRDGEIEGQRLLPVEMAQLLRHEQLTYPRARGSVRILTGRGFAWETGTFAGEAFCHHGGGYFGTATYAALLPDQRSGFFILMNTDGYAQSLAGVVAVDLLHRLTGKVVAPSMLEDTLAKVRDYQAQDAQATPEPEGGPLPLGSLSAAARNGTGDFVNADWGTLRAEPAGESLRLSLGHVELRVLPDGTDAFSIHGPILQGAHGRLVVGDDGKVSRLLLDMPDLGEAAFTRP